MPEFLAPGVFVQEVSAGAKAIEGVPTDVAAFVGPTARGPLRGRPSALTSVADYEHTYGDATGTPAGAASDAARAAIALAVRAYFENGGRRLYVARVAARPGRAPTPAAYQAALRRLEGLDDVCTVAAPGCSLRPPRDRGGFVAIQHALIAHAGRPGACRFAVLETPPDQTAEQVQQLRTHFDSSHAALYYPWIVSAGPSTDAAGTASDLAMAPSGAVCGIYARNDANHGVSKAPANLVVAGSLRCERDIGAPEQEVLNPVGINCLRAIAGKGVLVWGARTLASDPEWKYVNVRRYANYVEASIGRGLRWAASEPNAEPLWHAVAAAVADFLLREWRRGALIGTKPEEAFFVRCDRTTMTQDDIDQGRLVCLVGVAMVRPAEFTIFRIGQWTADRP